MPSVKSRRTSLAYSTDLARARIAPVETPIERVTDAANNRTSTASKFWSQDNTLDNIRLTPFGHERTDYTYGDSGSYRAERVSVKWATPNMSRPPLHGTHIAGKTISTLGSHTLNDSGRELDSFLTERRSTMTTSGFEHNHLEELDDDAASSKSSVASSRSSTRVSRVRCQRVQGEWCIHTECVGATPGNRRATMGGVITHQRNTNNTADVTFTMDQAGTDTPSGRHRHRQQQQQPVQRRSTRSSMKSSSATANQVPQDHNELNYHTDRSNRLASASSTYVYTYVPPDADQLQGGKVSIASFERGDGPELTDRTWNVSSYVSTGHERSMLATRFGPSTKSSFSGKMAQKWLARHIFGLESSSAANTSNHFVPSDVEESDTIIASRPFSRQTGAPQPGITRDRRLHCPDSSQSQLSQTLWQGVNALKQMTFSGLAFMLAGLSLTYDTLNSCVAKSSSAFWMLFSHHPSYSPQESRAKLAVHPRLTQFDGHSPARISSTEESDFFSRVFRRSVTCFSKAGSICFRLMGCLCFLIPLLLLLAFLFAPVAVTDDEPPPVWPSFLSDTDCKQALLDSRPSDATIWQLARWRFRCLYHLYFLTPDLPSNTTSSESPSMWQRFQSFLWTSTPAETPPINIPTDLPLNIDKSLLAQLEAFREVVNKRLDILANTMHQTDERVTKIEQSTESRFDDINLNLNSLKQQFNEHSTALDSWRVQLQALQALAGRLDHSEPKSQVALNDYDRLFNAVISAANQTIARELNLLRVELKEKTLSLANQHNSTVSHLSMLLSQLRQQLTERLEQTESKLADLRAQMQSRLHAQTVNHTSLVTSMNDVRLTVDSLSGRLAQLREANAEFDLLLQKLQQATRDCNERQLNQVEQCKQAAFKSAESSVAAFSERLTEQMTALVKESLLHNLNDASVDEALKSKMLEMVKQSARDAVERALHGTTISGSPSDGDTSRVLTLDAESRLYVQKLIDASLDRFAADRVGKADFALESAGGSIVGTRCTRTYTDRAALFTIFGIPLARLSNSARTILQPGNNPGDCWAFHGSAGQAVIRLSAPIVISSVSLEHLPRVLAPNQRVDSAPKEFVIKGLTSEADEGVILGTFVYDIDGPSIQTFPLEGQSSTWQLIEFGVLSNHGHPLYTCVYRLRVHGTIPAAV